MSDGAGTPGPGERPDRSPLDVEPTILQAPLPTPRTLRRRRNVLVQLVRFASLNLRMAYIALRGHR